MPDSADNILQPPRKLEKRDKRGEFDCGVPSLDEWFRRYALQNQLAHNCTVYVTTWNEHVAGYYALCAGGIEKDLAPADFGKRRPNVIPVMVLARLAVDRRAQGKGVGSKLLLDALSRCLAAARDIGAAAVVVHAIDEDAKSFYMQHADFQEFPGEPLHLLLPIKHLAELL